MKETTGKVQAISYGGTATINAYVPEGVDASQVRVLWYDSEMINHEQRKKIFALVGDIAAWSGHDPEYTRKNLTADFLRANIERLQMSAISLAITGNCDKGTASLYIDYLINFCLENSVWHDDMRPLYENCEDIHKYVYACLLHKKCCICGRKAELHHVDSVGMGYNRREKPQIGALVLPLAPEYHREWHNIGRTAFEEKYHIEPVRLDERLAGVYGLTRKAQREGNYGQAV